MRLRVSSLTVGLPRKARDTVGWETPARYAISFEVALPFISSPSRAARVRAASDTDEIVPQIPAPRTERSIKRRFLRLTAKVRREWILRACVADSAGPD